MRSTTVVGTIIPPTPKQTNDSSIKSYEEFLKSDFLHVKALSLLVLRTR